MPTMLIAVISFVLSGLIFRLLASIGFSLGVAFVINKVINDYLVRSVNQMGTALTPEVSAFLNLIGADDALSVMIGGVAFVATWKSLKLIFVRK